MNFQQLKIIREALRQGFNLTEVANALYTSQSGVSKHIKDLEDELGVEIFIRKGKRLLGMTEPGKELAVIAERILLDAQNIRNVATHFSRRDEGELTVATTHTQARYVLPRVVSEFKKQFPRVHLKLHQGRPDEIAAMLLAGKADIGIATEAIAEVPELVSFPYYPWEHALITPADHPLTTLPVLTLKDIAEYPIITYHEGFTGRARLDRVFSAAGLAPDVVMSAMDADVIKSYVEIGLGIGIIASMAYNAGREGSLVLLEAGHLFETNITRIAIHRGHYLRGFEYRFLELCSPTLDATAVHEALGAK